MLKQQLTVTDVSIITNDCLGSILYHDFGMRFTSPTINLFFDTDEDYLEYLEHIAYYSTTKPTQIFRQNLSYPIGRIDRGNNSITIHFMHYRSFGNACAKWLERGKRINYDRLLLIRHSPTPDGPPAPLFERFMNLPEKSKLLITGKDFQPQHRCVQKLNIYGKKYYNGKYLLYKNIFSVKRYFHDADIVGAINCCQ